MAELKIGLEKLVNLGVRFVEWHEPDRKNELTAIASEPIWGERRKLFRNFNLLKGE